MVKSIKINGHEGFIEFKVIDAEKFRFFEAFADEPSLITIKSENYYVYGSQYWFTLWDIKRLYNACRDMYEKQAGEHTYYDYDGALEFKIIYKHGGHYEIIGNYRESYASENYLNFEFTGNPDHMYSTLQQMRSFIQFYSLQIPKPEN